MRRHRLVRNRTRDQSQCDHQPSAVETARTVAPPGGTGAIGTATVGLTGPDRCGPVEYPVEYPVVPCGVPCGHPVCDRTQRPLPPIAALPQRPAEYPSKALPSRLAMTRQAPTKCNAMPCCCASALACSFAPYYSEKLLHLAQSFQAASHAHLHATFEPRQMLRKHFSAHTPVAVHRPSQPVAMSQCVQRCNARYSVIRRLIRFDTAAATARPCVSVLRRRYSAAQRTDVCTQSCIRPLCRPAAHGAAGVQLKRALQDRHADVVRVDEYHPPLSRCGAHGRCW